MNNRGIDAFQFELLQRLVTARSVNPPGGEKAAALVLAGVLEELGFTVGIHDIAPERANLVATLRGGAGPEIVLTGHLDVVAAVSSQWKGDPFILRREGTRLFGRGVADMKGALTSMVAAARELVASGGSPKGALSLVFVADEEDKTLGTKRYVAGGARPDAVIIGEPTGMNVCVAHRGVSRYEIEIVGRSGHAARPRDAVNPITIAGRFAQIADERNNELAATAHPFLPPATLAVTMISAAEQANVIPGRCRLTIDRRTLPGEDMETLRAELDAMRRRLPGEESTSVSEPFFTVNTQSGHTMPGSRLAEDCRAVLARHGFAARIHDFPAGCDQFVFTAAGIDCLLIGPGDIAQAHTVDEFIEIGQLALARDFYRDFIREKLQWII